MTIVNFKDSFVFGKGGKLVGYLVLGDGDDLVLIEDGADKAQIADFASGALGGDVTGANRDASLADLSTNGRFVSSFVIPDGVDGREPAWRPMRKRRSR